MTDQPGNDPLQQPGPDAYPPPGPATPYGQPPQYPPTPGGGYQQPPANYPPVPGYQQPPAAPPAPAYDQADYQAYPQTAGYPQTYIPSPGSELPLSKLSVAALSAGVTGIMLSACCAFIGIPAAIAAVVLGYFGLKETATGMQRGRGMAIAGIILGGIGLLLGIAVVVFAGVMRMNTQY